MLTCKYDRVTVLRAGWDIEEWVGVYRSDKE